MNQWTEPRPKMQKEKFCKVIPNSQMLMLCAEMVDMITITRAYEAGQKVIRSYDSMLDKSVNQVGALNSLFGGGS